VVNNQVGWGISVHTRDTEKWRGIPAYASGNTSTNGVANYNDGTYVLMLIRIHMHKGRPKIHRSPPGPRRCRFHPQPAHRVYLAMRVCLWQSRHPGSAHTLYWETAGA
jgi:hypothetical protein